MANDPTTYAGLVTSLANWLNRDDLNTTEIPEAIALAERKFQRELFIPEQETETTLTATAEVVALPSDFLEAKDVYLNTDPRTELEWMNLSTLRNSYPSQTTGKPQNYSIRGESMILGPAPDTSYDVKLAYIQKFQALGTSQTTNALITDHPDVYKAGALEQLNLLLRDYEAASTFGGECDEIISSINMHTIRRKEGATPLRIRPPQVV
jgi:hypothetical protein